MNTVGTSALSLAAAVVLLGATVVACGSDKGSSPTSTSSSTPAASSPSGAQDYGKLLIKPADVGPNAFVEEPPTPNPSGVTGIGQVFKNPDGNRVIVDTIAVFPDAAAAMQTATNRDVVARKVTGALEPIDIGSNGFMVAGQSADPSRPMEISEVIFVEGRAVVDLEFDCVLGNPTPNDVLLDLARKQDAAVKSGLPS
jgi:hypothetical protein